MKNYFLIIIIVAIGVTAFLAIQTAGYEKSIRSNPEIMDYCKIISYCGDFAEVDCGAEVDGPLFYVNKYSGKIIEYCGGYCMGGPREGKYCINCPPQEWNCRSMHD